MDELVSATRAIELGDQSTRAWLRLAMALRTLRRWSDFEMATKAAHAAAGRAEDFAALGEFLVRLEDHDRACAAYDRALSLHPDHLPYLFNRAAVRRFLGAFEAAEQDCDRVIALDRRDSEAWRIRSQLRTQTPARNHIEALEGRLREGFESRLQEVPIRYALGKGYEDLARYGESWHHLIAGAAIRRRHRRYDVRVDVATVDWIIEAFDGGRTSAPGCPSGRPIFIVGMPRTGTTLLERILSGSPQEDQCF